MSLWSEMNKMLCWLQGVQLWLVVAVKVAGPSRSAGRLTLRMYAKWAWGRMWSPHSSFFFCCAWFSSALLNLMWVQQVWTLASRWFALTMGFIFCTFCRLIFISFVTFKFLWSPCDLSTSHYLLLLKCQRATHCGFEACFSFFFNPAWCYS